MSVTITPTLYSRVLEQVPAQLLKVLLDDTMKTITPLQPIIPVAKLRCGRCASVFIIFDQPADSLISKLLFGGVKIGDLVTADCRQCGHNPAKLMDAGYIHARS